MEKNQDLNIGISNFIFILILVFVILFYFLAFGGLVLSDDYSYAEYAFQIMNGTFEFNRDIFSHRLGMILPTSILYYFFGVNDVTTTLWALLCYLGTACLMYKVFYSYRLIAIWALVISSLNFYPIYFSNKLFPDVVVSFFMLASVMVVYRFRGRTIGKVWVALAFSLSFFVGFLTKETILYLLPFYAFVLVHDLLKEKHYVFWLLSLGMLIGIGVIYFGMYYYYERDFFYRFRIIQEGHYPFGYSYFDKSFTQLLARISYEPLMMFISSELFIPFALALPVMLNLRVRDFYDLDNKEKFFGFLSLMLLLMYWFGSTSYLFYNPLSLNPRMFIMMVAPLSIVAGISLSQLPSNRSRSILYAFLFFGAAAIAYFKHAPHALGIYLLLGCLFLFIRSIYSWERHKELLLVWGIILVLLVHPVYVILKTDRRNFKDQKEIINANLNVKAEKTVVITDPLVKLCVLYFYKFVPNEKYTYLSYKEISQLKDIKAERYYLLVNPKNVEELLATGYKVPDYFIHPSSQWKLIQKRGEVSLFEISGIEDIPNKP